MDNFRSTFIITMQNVSRFTNFGDWRGDTPEQEPNTHPFDSNFHEVARIIGEERALFFLNPRM